jgi:hypothetical protein
MEMMVERVSSDTSGQFTKFVHRDSWYVLTRDDWRLEIIESHISIMKQN